METYFSKWWVSGSVLLVWEEVAEGAESSNKMSSRGYSAKGFETFIRLFLGGTPRDKYYQDI